jgi:hypothetical protein
MSNKATISILAVFVIVVVMSIITTQRSMVSASQPYSDGDLGFSLRHPPSWEPNFDVEGLDVAFVSSQEDSSDTFREYVSVTVDAFEEGQGLDEVVDVLYAGLAEDAVDSRELERSPANLSGLDAIRIVARFRINGRLVQNLMYFVVDDDRLFVVNCCARKNTFDYWEGLFEEMSHSLKIDA